jgi:hypothetical protein
MPPGRNLPGFVAFLHAGWKQAVPMEDGFHLIAALISLRDLEACDVISSMKTKL